jgi:hypothetical protein
LLGFALILTGSRLYSDQKSNVVIPLKSETEKIKHLEENPIARARFDFPSPQMVSLPGVPMDVPLSLPVEEPPREWFDPRRIGVKMEAPPNRKPPAKAFGIPDPPRLEIPAPHGSEAVPFSPHQLPPLHDEKASKEASKPVENLRSPRLPSDPPPSGPPQQVMASKAQAIPLPPRLSERDFDLQARNDGFRELLERMHRLEAAEAKKAEGASKRKGRKSHGHGRKSRGARSLSHSPLRRDLASSDDPGSDDKTSNDKASNDKASKKVKLSKKLTKSVGKERAKAMRKEAHSVANEFFSTATAFSQPGIVWHE